MNILTDHQEELINDLESPSPLKIKRLTSDLRQNEQPPPEEGERKIQNATSFGQVEEAQDVPSSALCSPNAKNPEYYKPIQNTVFKMEKNIHVKI